MFNWISQIISVSLFNLRSLPQRLGSSLTAVLGIAGVVAVTVSVLSIGQGIVRTMENSSDPGNVIVLRSGATSEMMSGLNGDEVRWIAESPGLARLDDGSLASAELFVIIDVPLKSTGTAANVPMRGVSLNAARVRENFNIVEGRMFEPGLNEVIVGIGGQESFAGLEVGDRITIAQEEWPIVGSFTTNGGISETEIWVDAAVLQQAYRRGNSYQSVYAKLDSPEQFQQFKDALTTDPRLNVKAMKAEDYYSEQSTMLTNLITGLGTLVAILMGFGAVFGALNTMYTAVASRAREIATLRALGFHSGPVVISVLFESMVLAFVGGLLGATLAWVVFDGFQASTVNMSSFSQVAFSFDVSMALLITGIVFAMIIGTIGGLFPAIRAARQPISSALREL